MRFFLLFCSFGLLGFPSCGEKSSCSLTQDQMMEILMDVQIAETAAQSLASPVKDSVQEVYYRQIFEIHGVGEEAFKICFEELQADPERMSAVYEKIVDEMKLQGAKQLKKKEVVEEEVSD